MVQLIIQSVWYIFQFKTQMDFILRKIKTRIQIKIQTFQQNRQRKMEYSQRFRAGSFPVNEHSAPSVQNFQLIKQQLDRETSALLNERKNIDLCPSLNSMQTVTDPKNTRPISKKTQDTGIRSQLSRKIQQIMKLCQEDKNQIKHGFQQMSEAQKKILNLLTENRTDTLELQNYEVDGSGKKTQTPTPIAPTSQSNYRRSAIDRLKTDRNQPITGSNFQNLKEELQKQKLSGNDLLEMIEEIQRKALAQIEGLKREKVELLKKLNQEIKAHHEEKKIRVNFQQKFQQMTPKHMLYSYGSEVPFPGVDRIPETIEEQNPETLQQKIEYLIQQNKKLKIQKHQYQREESRYQRVQNNFNKPDTGECQQLKYQISVLEKKLSEYQIEVDRLKNHQIENGEAGLLYEQGQNLRLQTLHLLRKKGLLNPQYDRIIKDLQYRLQEEQRAKNEFLKDLQMFKKKLRQLEYQNQSLKGEKGLKCKAPLYTNSSGYEIPRRPSSYYSRQRLGQYESLIGEIKRVAY